MSVIVTASLTRTGRRALLRSGAATVAGALALASATAAPSIAAANPIVLVWQPWWWGPSMTPSGQKLLYEGTAPFRERNRGVDLRIAFVGLQDALAAALIGGSGPDVFEDWVISAFTDRGLVLNLEPFIRRDNVDLSVFTSGMVKYLQVNGSSAPAGPGFYALPDYLHQVGQAVNTGLLDELGMTYPEPDWSYQQWGDFWLKTSSKAPQKNGRPRVGGGIYWWSEHGSGAAPSAWYWHAWGGGFVNPNDNTQPLIDSAASVAFGEYIFNLLFEGAINQYGDSAGFVTGNQVSMELGTAGDLPAAATNWRGVKWSVYPMPVGRAGQFNGSFESFYAANAATKYPEQAWQFIKWLCYEKEWPRFMMRIALQGPVRKDLWQEWQAIVESAAPPLRHVNLGSFVTMAEADRLWCDVPFRYYDEQCGGVINEWVGKIIDKQVDVAGGLAQAARQMAQLEIVGRRYNGDLGATRAFQAYLARARSTTAPFATPLPPRTDQGTPAQDAPQLVLYDSKRSTCTITGAGTGLTGDADGGTFACAPYAVSRATFTCRLTAINSIKANSIPGGAKVGLMVRSSLSSGAATACINVALGHSVQFFSRPFPGSTQVDQNTVGGGLLPGSSLLVDNSKAAANYLLKPLWLRLVGDGGQWTAFTSLDGHTWLQAGTTAIVGAEGVWVGLFVTSHAAGQYVRAAFDHLSGLPTLNTFVQMATTTEHGTH